MSGKRVKVLYVCGAGRSGSTILDRILGQVQGFFSVGEIRVIWDRRLQGQTLCGCGVEVKECKVWRAIFEKAFGAEKTIDRDTMREIYTGARIRSVFGMLAPGGRRRLATQAERHAETISRLYKAVEAATNCDLIVDSSKVAAYGYILGNLPGIDLYVVHLIRDPRAIAYSWQRHKPRRDMRRNGTGPQYMDRRGPLMSSMDWSTANLASERLWRRDARRYMRMRYEDFVANPRLHIQRILDLVGDGNRDLAFVNGHTAKLEVDHTFSGNPDRVETGWVTLRRDDDWRKALRQSHRNLVTALTWPLLLRYGYPLFGGTKV